MAVRVDGKAIAGELKRELIETLQKEGLSPVLSVFVLTDDLATEKFIALKQRFAEDIGVRVSLVRLPETTTTEELVKAIGAAVPESQGIIVQFPLPPQIDRDAVRNAVPADRDVDLISDAALENFEKGSSVLLPPVVGALSEILKRYEISIAGKRVIVVGEGRLVGKPSAVWATFMGADVQVVHEHTEDAASIIQSAEVLILGAGVPGLVTADMVREGVVVLDAGTSEAAGRLAGDMDVSCVSKASLYTPVPGGMGPITVAMIFKNLLYLVRSRR